MASRPVSVDSGRGSGLSFLVQPERSGEFGNIPEVLFTHELIQLANHPERRDWVGEGGCPDLHGTGACNEILRRILAAADSPQTHYRYADCLAGLVNHAQGNRLDSGAGKTSEAGSKPGCP